jgi:hypothetical protein
MTKQKRNAQNRLAAITTSSGPLPLTNLDLDPAIQLARAEKAKRQSNGNGKLRIVEEEITTTVDRLPKRSTSKRSKIEKAAPEAVNAAVRTVKPKVKKEAKPPRPKITAHSILASGKMSARGLTCLCGCGAPTMTQDARFLPGHDAKMRAAILSHPTAAARTKAIPEIIRPFFRHGETIAGLWLNEQGQIEDVKQSASTEGGDEDTDDE